MEDLEKKKAKLQALLGGDPSAVKEVKNVMVAAEVVAEEKGLPTIPVKPIKKETTRGSKQVIVEDDGANDRAEEAFKKFNLRESVKSQFTPPPVVSEDATLALISGNRQKLKEITKQQESVEREIPQENFDVNKQLKERVAKQQLPKSKLLGEGIENDIFEKLNDLQHPPISKEEIREIVKEEIYNILSEVYKKEEENRLMTETIHIRIGETIFSGKLTPISKVKPKK